MFNRSHIWGRGGLYLLFFVCVSLLFTEHTYAATGINHTINFQGKLVNSDGTNVSDSTYSIVFSLYTVSSGGSNAWTETDSVTTKDGVFRVSLGAGTTFSSASIDFNSDTYYLGVKVGSDAEMTPRIQFTAVPYAFNAQEVNGLTVTDNGGNTLNIAANKTLAVNNSLTFNGTDATSFTLPATTNGTILTTNQSNQTVNPGQASGTIFAVNNSTAETSALTGLSITLSGTGAFDQTGLSFNLTNASGTNLNDILGTGSTWKVSRSGAATLAGLTLPGLTGNNAVLYATAGTGVVASAITSSANQCLLSGVGNAPSWGSCGSGTNFWAHTTNNSNQVLNPATLTDELSIGVDGTSANFIPFSSLFVQPSINSKGNALVGINQTGSGPIFTASQSGTTKFVIDNSGNVIVGNDQGTPTAVTIRGGAANGSNIAGANLTFDASNGTGSGGSGDLIFRTAGATVTASSPIFDKASTIQSGTTSPLTWTHTVAVQSNPILIVTVALGQTAFPVSNVTYNGVSMTRVTPSLNCPNVTSSCTDEMWYMVNPPTGAADTISVSWTGGTQAMNAGSSSYYNVNTSTPFGTIKTTTGTSAGFSNSATTTSTQLVVDAVANGAVNNIAANGGQTQLYVLNAASSGGSSYKASSGTSTTLGWTDASSDNWAQIIAPINGASSGGSIADTLTDRLHLTSGGLVGINSSSPLATLDVRANSGTLPIASVSGASSFAGLVVNNSGVGDIFTASSSGLTRLQIANNGATVFEGDSITSVGNGGSSTTSNAVSNAIGDQGSLVPNAGFESAITGIGFADGWAVAATNSAAVTRDTTTQAKGQVSAKITLNASQSTAIYSTCVPLALVSGTGSYNINYYVKGSSAIPVVRAYLDEYTSKANCQSNTTPTIPAPITSTAITTSWAVKSNANASSALANGTWGRVHIFVGCVAACSAGTVVNIDGVRLIENALTGGIDYAENYPADPINTPQPGDVVTLESMAGLATVKPADIPEDQSAIGVVSTNPGEVLDDGSITGPKVPIALVGRIPTKVSIENGPIHIGDYLTTSDMPGVAVKAVTAGPVIGTAMQEYDGTSCSDSISSANNDVCEVTMFVKNSYYAGGTTTASIFTNTNPDTLTFLGNLVDEARKKGSTANFSTITADRFAGLQVIAPTIVSDNIFVNTIHSTGQNLSIQLGTNGQFVIADQSGNKAVQFDSLGNAIFKGTLIADKIQANQIEGIAMITNQLIQLSSNVASLSADVRVLSASTSADSSTTHNNVIASGSAAISNELNGLSVDSNATVSGELRVKGNSLFEGVLSVIDSFKANNIIATGVAEFFNTVLFHNDVSFEGRATFNADTAGFAVIKKGMDHVAVAFNTPYNDLPVVNATLIQANLSLTPTASDGKTLDEQILDTGYTYLITNRSPRGFTIILNKSADQDLQFSWSAISVSNAKIFQSDKNIVSPAPSVSPSL